MARANRGWSFTTVVAGKVRSVDVPSFALAAILTPAFLFLLFAIPFYLFDEAGPDLGAVFGFAFLGLVYASPFYFAIGLPLAWATVRRRAALGSRALISGLLVAAVIANAASLMLVGASCFLFAIEYGCDFLGLFPFALLGFPHAVVMALTFALFYGTLRAWRGVP